MSAKPDRRVKFTRDFDWNEPGLSATARTIAYEKGMELEVPAEVAEAAIAAHAAEPVKGVAVEPPAKT